MNLWDGNKRLCRLPCGMPLAFRQATDSFGGYAARGEASRFSKVRPESQRHSAREAAKPQINLSTNYNP